MIHYGRSAKLQRLNERGEWEDLPTPLRKTQIGGTVFYKVLVERHRIIHGLMSGNDSANWKRGQDFEKHFNFKVNRDTLRELLRETPQEQLWNCGLMSIDQRTMFGCQLIETEEVNGFAFVEKQ